MRNRLSSKLFDSHCVFYQNTFLVVGKPPSFLVVQFGARRNYGVPEAFAKLGALSGLYTDFAENHGLGAKFGQLVKHHSRIASKLHRRHIPSGIGDLVRTFELEFIGSLVRRKFGGTALGYDLSRFLRERVERSMISRGVKGATHIYTMLGEGGEFLPFASRSGVRIVSDVFIALSADRIVAEECNNFPDWADEEVGAAFKHAASPEDNSIMLQETDLFICPSQFVADDLIRNHAISEEKIRVIPYAVSEKWRSLTTSPEPGRVLFAGSANLRKGIHYLAEAALQLKGKAKVVVAGQASAKVRNHPQARELEFLGHLGPVEMAREFARADVFVLPSLAEGSAGVTAEALGAGVPVVTTNAAGSIVRDGIDGFIVPERNSEALAEAVRAIVEDRGKREAMSRAARERAQQFTWDGFARQVIEATQCISEPAGK